MWRPISGNPNVAVVAATRTSHSSARAKPPAIAGPLTAATIGSGSSASARNRRRLVSTIRSLCGRSPPNCVTSMPAQNAVPAPVSTRQRTPSSAAASSSATASSVRSSSDSVLRFSGRSSVSRTTPPEIRSTRSGMRDSFAVMAAGRFDHHTLILLAEADEIEMRTARGDGTASSRPIWVVVVDGLPYVRSYAGERGAWYRHARRDGRAEVGVGGETLPVRAIAAAGKADEQVSAAYHDKYGRQSPGPTEAMVTPPVVATTLRLEPPGDGCHIGPRRRHHHAGGRRDRQRGQHAAAPRRRRRRRDRPRRRRGAAAR